MKPSGGIRDIANKRVYKEKKDYGIVPEYLKHKNEMIAKMKNQEKELVSHEKMLKNKGYFHVSKEERLKILSDLKDNWKRLEAEYMKLSLVVDTVPKIARYDTFI